MKIELSFDGKKIEEAMFHNELLTMINHTKKLVLLAQQKFIL